jgi:nucleotide-binding universal stress UspA family protein
MGRIVVGIDGSDSSRDALAWAMEMGARLDDVEVVAVHACEDAATAYEKGFCTRSQAEKWLEESRAEAERALGRLLREVGAADRRGEVLLETVPGRPAQVLIDASASAELLVVGPRGHGRLRGLLGSVSQACVVNSRCPVVVVPSPSGDGE